MSAQAKRLIWLAVPIGLLLLVWLGVCWRANKTWDALWEQQLEDEARLAAVEVPRTCFHEASIEGNAFVAYAAACELMELAKVELPAPARTGIIKWLEQDASFDPCLACPSYGLAMEQLHRAALFDSARDRSFSTEASGAGALALDVISVFELSWVALRHAERLAQRGQMDQATDALLDLLNMGRDLAHGSTNSSMQNMGAVALKKTCAQLGEATWVGALGQSNLRRLIQSLAILDNEFPLIGPRYDAHYLEHVRNLLDQDLVEMGAFDVAEFIGLVEYSKAMFQSKIFMAGAIEDAGNWNEQLRLVGESDWPSAKLVYDQLHQVKDERFQGYFEAALARRHFMRREARASIRLARMALAHRQGDPIPQLGDPFGGMLQAGF
jgi:hypothetical protein